MYTKFSNLNFRWFSPYSLATSSKLIKGRRLVSCLSKSVLSHLVIQIIPNLNIIQSTAYMWNYDESWGYIYGTISHLSQCIRPIRVSMAFFGRRFPTRCRRSRLRRPRRKARNVAVASVSTAPSPRRGQRQRSSGG
jgi:hypothetical protein